MIPAIFHPRWAIPPIQKAEPMDPATSPPGTRRAGRPSAKRIALVVVMALGLALWGWHALAGRKLVLATPTRGPAADLVYATGYVEADEPVSVAAQLTAPVKSVLVEEGEAVRAGQVLVVLDEGETRGLLVQAQAQARGAGLEEGRQTTLFRQGWVTGSARDAAVATADAARAAVAAAKGRLAQTTVRAGINGVVLKRDVYPGDLAAPGKELLQLGDPARIRVTATVDERDIPRVSVGQPVVMSTDALPGRILHGTVSEITPGGDSSQRAFRIRIKLNEAAGAPPLPFGLTLEVNVITHQNASALLVPAGALAGGHVWVAGDGHAHRRAVVTGVSGPEKVEIRSGLAPDETVIVSPPADLAEGDRVRG